MKLQRLPQFLVILIIFLFVLVSCADAASVSAVKTGRSSSVSGVGKTGGAAVLTAGHSAVESVVASGHQDTSGSFSSKDSGTYTATDNEVTVKVIGAKTSVSGKLTGDNDPVEGNLTANAYVAAAGDEGNAEPLSLLSLPNPTGDVMLGKVSLDSPPVLWVESTVGSDVTAFTLPGGTAKASSSSSGKATAIGEIGENSVSATAEGISSASLNLKGEPTFAEAAGIIQSGAFNGFSGIMSVTGPDGTPLAEATGDVDGASFTQIFSHAGIGSGGDSGTATASADGKSQAKSENTIVVPGVESDSVKTQSASSGKTSATVSSKSGTAIQDAEIAAFALAGADYSDIIGNEFVDQSLSMSIVDTSATASGVSSSAKGSVTKGVTSASGSFEKEVWDAENLKFIPNLTSSAKTAASGTGSTDLTVRNAVGSADAGVMTTSVGDESNILIGPDDLTFFGFRASDFGTLNANVTGNVPAVIGAVVDGRAKITGAGSGSADFATFGTSPGNTTFHSEISLKDPADSRLKLTKGNADISSSENITASASYNFDESAPGPLASTKAIADIRISSDIGSVFTSTAGVSPVDMKAKADFSLLDIPETGNAVISIKGAFGFLFPASLSFSENGIDPTGGVIIYNPNIQGLKEMQETVFAASDKTLFAF